MTRPDGCIGHAEIQIGDTCVMMADEHPEIGRSVRITMVVHPSACIFYVDDWRREISAGHRGLEAKQVREPADQPYGDRNAGVVDPFGYKWWIAAHIKGGIERNGSPRH